MSVEEDLDAAGSRALIARENFWLAMERADARFPEGTDELVLMAVPAVRQAYAQMDAAQRVYQAHHREYMAFQREDG